MAEEGEEPVVEIRMIPSSHTHTPQPLPSSHRTSLNLTSPSLPAARLCSAARQVDTSDTQMARVLGAMSLSTLDLQLASLKVSNLASILSAQKARALQASEAEMRRQREELSQRNEALAQENQQLTAKLTLLRDLRVSNVRLKGEKQRLEAEKRGLERAVQPLEEELSRAKRELAALTERLSHSQALLSRHASLDGREANLARAESQLALERANTAAASAAAKRRGEEHLLRSEQSAARLARAELEAALSSQRTEHAATLSSLQAELSAAREGAAREREAAVLEERAAREEGERSLRRELAEVEGELRASRERASAELGEAVAEETSELRRQLAAVTTRLEREEGSRREELSLLRASLEAERGRLEAEMLAKEEGKLREAAELREKLLREAAEDRRRDLASRTEVEGELRRRFQQELQVRESEAEGMRAELAEAWRVVAYERGESSRMRAELEGLAGQRSEGRRGRRWLADEPLKPLGSEEGRAHVNGVDGLAAVVGAAAGQCGSAESFLKTFQAEADGMKPSPAEGDGAPAAVQRSRGRWRGEAEKSTREVAVPLVRGSSTGSCASAARAGGFRASGGSSRNLMQTSRRTIADPETSRQPSATVTQRTDDPVAAPSPSSSRQAASMVTAVTATPTVVSVPADTRSPPTQVATARATALAPAVHASGAPVVVKTVQAARPSVVTPVVVSTSTSR